MHIRNLIPSFLLLTSFTLSPAMAQQGIPSDTMLNTLSVTASVNDSVEQDYATITLFVERKNSNPTRLANEVNSILQNALETAKKEKDIKTSQGTFRTWPITSSKSSVIDAWQSRAEIMIESKNIAALSELSNKLITLGMEVGSLRFSLSPETQILAEKRLNQAAVAAFREKASTMTKLFGMTQYDIVDITLFSNTPVPYNLMPLQAGILADSPRQAMPISAGESTVTVTISGRIRMR